MSADGRWLLVVNAGSHDVSVFRVNGYTRNGGNGTISAFSVNGDGTLTPLSIVGGLPSGANGVAAR